MNISIHIGGKPIKVHYEHERFVHEILTDKQYDFLFNDLVVLDAGCNIGVWTFSIYDKIKQGYALDFSRECLDVMEKTIRENDIKNIVTHCVGLAANTGKRKVKLDPTPQLGGSKFNDDGELEVDAMDIEQFMKYHNIPYIDVMKIDIEGAEKEVFESGAFNRVAPRIHTIIGEIHDENPLRFLEKTGYRITRQDEVDGLFIARRFK